VSSIPTIVIVGFMGSGKTAVGRALAAQLNLVMTDLDRLITDASGRTPAEIITQDGERAFREIESNALREILKTTRAGIIALGGGAWIEETNRRLIGANNCLTIWLETPFEKCWKRIQSSGEERPLGKTEQQAKDLFERRRPVYQLATLHVEALSDETADELATRIKSELATFNT
jgi:shikimate kinase